MDYNISIILDKRRIKENGKFPLKLRVYQKFKKKVKLYPLNIDLTNKEFQTIWINPEGKNLRGSNKDLNLTLKAIETRANNAAKDMTVFDLARFETKFFRKSSDKNNVKYHFNLAMNKCLKDKKIGTAESFKYSLNSFAEFYKNKSNGKIDKLTFDLITVDWLKEYEKYMIETNRGYTSVSIYARSLRVVFNNAIEAEDISKDIYPFGKNKYKIPRTRKVKKALNSKQLSELFNAELLDNNEEQSRDFWFFSYVCNGMNVKDISLLKYSDIKNDSFTYFRAKTIDKTTDKKEITIFLTDFTKGIISKYGKKDKSDYVFDVISPTDDIEIQYKKIKNFNRKINDHIKRISKRIGLPDEISSNWARHSFATNSMRKGAKMEFISEALNHSDLSVTKNYFAGFEDEAKKEFTNSLLDF